MKNKEEKRNVLYVRLGWMATQGVLDVAALKFEYDANMPYLFLSAETRTIAGPHAIEVMDLRADD